MSAEQRVLLFTGEGKGKTTAGLGTVLRAWGHGLPVAVVYFVKSRRDTGEVLALERLEGVDQFVRGLGFLPAKDSPEFQEHADAAVAALGEAGELMRSGRYRMLLLDEICYAVHRGLLSEQEVLDTFENRPADFTLILTGRFAGEKLIEFADTVSAMKVVKHGYDAGIPAQLGVEK